MKFAISEYNTLSTAKMKIIASLHIYDSAYPF